MAKYCQPHHARMQGKQIPCPDADLYVLYVAWRAMFHAMPAGPGT